MTSPKPRPTRPRRLSTQGPAQTFQTSLSPSQAAWVASRGVPVAAYLRGLVERDQRETVVVRGSYLGWPAMAQPGRSPSVEYGRTAVCYGDSEWVPYEDGEGPDMHLTEAQAIDWCLTGTLPDLVKIGGDV